MRMKGRCTPGTRNRTTVTPPERPARSRPPAGGILSRMVFQDGRLKAILLGFAVLYECAFPAWPRFAWLNWPDPPLGIVRVVHRSPAWIRATWTIWPM